jgi:hypothetical protein
VAMTSPTWPSSLNAGTTTATVVPSYMVSVL